MKSYQATMQRLRNFADLNALTDGLSRLVHDLDAAEKAAARDKQAVKVARLVVLLDACRRAARRVPKVQAADPRAAFNLAEIERQQAEVDRLVKRLIMAGGGIEIGQVGLQRWAAETVAQAEAKPSPKPASRPAPTAKKPTVAKRPVAKRAARGGTCPQCKRTVDYIAQPVGVCPDCIDKLFPRIARSRR